MNTWWTLLIGGGSFVGGAVFADLISEEVRSRLDAVPRSLLELAARRVDADIRAELLDEWNGELSEILQGAEARPVTRLRIGLRYSVGLLVVAPRVGRILGRSIRQRRGLAVTRRIRINLGGPGGPVIDIDDPVSSAGVQWPGPGQEFSTEDLWKIQRYVDDHGVSVDVSGDGAPVASQKLNRGPAGQGGEA